MNFPPKEEMLDQFDETESEHGEIYSPQPQGQSADEKGEAETDQTTDNDDEGQG